MTHRVLVTGGAGYIGSIVVEQLLARGDEVIALDDLSTGHRAALGEGGNRGGVVFVQGDIGDRTLLDGLLQRHQMDAVVHLAAFALVAESVEQPEKYYANNVVAGRVLLDTAVAARVPRFIFSSSCAVYGHPRRMPIVEEMPTAPINPYGQTKLEFERLLEQAAQRNGLASVSLRYFNAAGASERYGEDHEPETHLIPNALGVALGRRPTLDVFGVDYDTPDGTAIRDYIHVDDIADAHVRALDLELDGAVWLNLGSGQGHSVQAVAEAARRITGRAIPTVERPPRPGDPPVLVSGGDRARHILGWQPRHSSLEEIVESAWRWHRAHPRGYSS